MLPFELVCPTTWWIEGELDPRALMTALADVHKRHEALHARYRRADPPVALIPPNPGMPQLRLLTDTTTEQDALDQLTEALQQPLDYTQGRNGRRPHPRKDHRPHPLRHRHPPHRLRRLVTRPPHPRPQPRLHGTDVRQGPRMGPARTHAAPVRTTSTPACATPPTSGPSGPTGASSCAGCPARARPPRRSLEQAPAWGPKAGHTSPSPPT